MSYKKIIIQVKKKKKTVIFILNFNLIVLALVANFKVEIVSSLDDECGEQVVII